MELRYGDSAFAGKIDPQKIRGVIRADVPLTEASQEILVARALDECPEQIGSFVPGEKVVIVTSDITRYTGSEIYLPLLVDRLNQQGIPDSDIEVIIALGIHRKQTDHEHAKILGPLYGRIAVADHECDNPGKLVFLGVTSTGVPVEINRTVAEADRLILTGTIGFHYFAGFGGGRKSILPGVASRASCMASHFAVLNPEPASGKNPAATTGQLDGNPVHRAMTEACAMVGPDLILNTVLSPDKRIVAVFAGPWQGAHTLGCARYAELFSYPIPAKADLVVVSCGGYPKDINFIQAHKSMEYGSQALRDGGVMILLAQCRDGYGNATFFNWFRHKDLKEFEAALRERYEINGQTAYSTLQKAQRFKVILVSDLPPEEVEAMSMIPAKTLDEGMVKAEGFLPEDYSAYVIPEGGTVLPVMKNS
jgi:nickel-dependent lactate racemase